MMGLGRFASAAGAWIARHRRSGTVRGLHRFASFVESAYENEGSQFQVNGEQDMLRKLTPAGFQTAIDVGANFGDWSYDAAAIWPSCHVHSFEVAPKTFETLRGALPPGLRDRITLNFMGLSEAPGTMQMYYFPDHPELTCDLPRHGTHRSEAFEAKLDAGDLYCDHAGIDIVDFLKIDVEGAEFRVLRGFGKRLAAQKVQCIQFEYGAFSTQTRFLLADYYAMLGELYWIGKIYPGYVDFRDYDWTREDFRFANFCCVLKRRPDLRALLS